MIEKIWPLAKSFGEILSEVEAFIRPGTKTKELDAAVSNSIMRRGLRSSFKGYRGYPASTSASVNEEITNSVPGTRELKRGDLLKFQTGVTDGTFHCSQGWTYFVGDSSEGNLKLAAGGEHALGAAVAQVRDGCLLAEIAGAIEDTLSSHGYAANPKLGGHGIGREHHEPPFIPCLRAKLHDPNERVHVGQLLSIHVIAHAGSPAARVGRDSWSMVTKDATSSVLFSQMVLVQEHHAMVVLPPRNSRLLAR